MSHEDEATLNIGALSMATGVPVETIRTWERRYGFPRSQRNEAGHRIYNLETIEHLRLITQILSCGYRPSQLEGRSREELEELLEKTTPAQQNDQPASKPEVSGPRELCGEQWCREWLEAVNRLDRSWLVGQLRSEYSRLNAVDFLQRRVVPFLIAVGDGWADGRLAVMHEHFASESLRDFLVDRWRPMSKSATGSPVILATFPGERHALGLHMVALVAAMSGHRVVLLGANTPVEDIASAAVQAEATAIASTISEYANSAASVSFLSKLRELVDHHVDIIIGGRGTPDDVTGVEVIDDLQELYDRLR